MKNKRKLAFVVSATTVVSILFFFNQNFIQLNSENHASYRSELDKEIEGRDNDQNGIRDDIDNLIATQFSTLTDQQKRYVYNLARGYQKIILGDRSNVAESFDQLSPPVQCLDAEGLNGLEISTLFFRKTINTSLRFNAYNTERSKLIDRIIPVFTMLELEEICSKL